MMNGFVKLSPEDILRLEKQGCEAVDWSLVFKDPELNLANIVNVRFLGEIFISKGVVLRNIPIGISGCKIGENATIENVGEITFEPEASHGVGTMISVLDETGSRVVPIFPGLNSQIATLIAREPGWLQKNLNLSMADFLDSNSTKSQIGERASIRNCGLLKNVSIGSEIIVEGASRLVNGSLINNACSDKCFTFVGNDVEAENFILEDGRLESKAHIHNCYIGQGVIISNGFSAHESLFSLIPLWKTGRLIRFWPDLTPSVCIKQHF